MNSFLMNSFLMSSFLIDQAVRATVLLIAAYLAVFAMRRASASARRLVWIAAAVCLLTMPMLSLLVPPISNGRVAAAPATVVMKVTSARSLSLPVANRIPAPKTPWIPILWAAGALVVLGRLAAGMIRLMWLKRTARLIESAGGVWHLVVDANGISGYQAGADYMITLTHPLHLS